jgi:hypothetical protein
MSEFGALAAHVTPDTTRWGPRLGYQVGEKRAPFRQRAANHTRSVVQQFLKSLTRLQRDSVDRSFPSLSHDTTRWRIRAKRYVSSQDITHSTANTVNMKLTIHTADFQA